MKPEGDLSGHGSEISRRRFIGLAAGGAALSLFNVPPVLANHGNGHSQYPVLTDYVGRLCYNENPLGPSPLAIEAINANADMAHRYPDWYAESLRNDLADHHNVSTGQVVAGCGATEILRLCALAFVDGGCNIVSPYPSYSQFPSDCNFLGASVRYSELDDEHRVDLDDMLSSVDNQTKAVIITNPNNPTGTVLPAADIADFVDSLPSQVVTIIDEAYHHYVDDPYYQTAIDLVQQDKKVVVIRTFSKVFGLAGLRIGYAVGRSELIQQLSSWHIWATVSRLALEASIAALDDNDHVNNTVMLNNQAKQYCFMNLTNMGLDFIPSQTNFFMLETELSGGFLAGELSSRGIQVRTGWGMSNHIRVSTGTMPEMENFITALDEILNNVSAGDQSRPAVTALDGNYPNPFNSSTRIGYSMASPGKVLIQIFNIRGQLVKTVVDGFKRPGTYAFEWDGRNRSGDYVASGSYFYRMTAGEFNQTRRMILIK
jgi:histidinol-phosphate aminotransferase